MDNRKSKERMKVSELVGSKLNEFGIKAKLLIEPDSKKSTFTIYPNNQVDRDWHLRLIILRKQLESYLNIDTMEIKDVDRILFVVRRNSSSKLRHLKSNNPLLNPINSNWRGVIPFDKIKLEHFLPAIKEGIEEAKAIHELIASNLSTPTFQNTFGHDYDYLGISMKPDLDYCRSVFSIYKCLCTTPETFTIANKVINELTRYHNSIRFDRRIYDRALAIDSEKYNEPLSNVELRMLNEVITSGKNAGYDLSEKDQHDLKDYNCLLSKYESAYENNATKATNAVVKVVEDIPGLPERALSNMRKEIDGKTVYEITLQAANVSDIFDYCTDRELRKEIYNLRMSRAFGGEFDNRKLCLKLANLRLQITQKLGRKTIADNILSHNRMRKSTEDVMQFLGSLLIPFQNSARRDMQELNQFIAKVEGPDFDPQPWDYYYYTTKLQKEKFNLDPEEVRKYFSYKKILSGIFWLAKQLYNLDYIKIDAPVYEEGVEVFEIMRGSKYMGILYIDPFMRSNKTYGAYCDNIISQGICTIDGVSYDNRPTTLIMTNIEPSGIMSFDDVQTLLHEFGHSLQETLSEVEYSTQSGNNVYWDYVELASQFMENFAYEDEFLERFATDDEGNVIPKEYIKSLKEQANFMKGSYYLRQLELCYIDMAWHTITKKFKLQDLDLVREVEHQALCNIKLPDGSIVPELRITDCKKYTDSCCYSTAFTHIFSGGYTAGYYSYLNADVLAADAFKAFGDNPIHNKEMADRFRRYILSAGNTEDPMELYKKFRGSTPEVSAFLEQNGLL